MKSKTVWEVLSTSKHPEQTKYLPFTKADPSVCRDCILVGLISLCVTLRHCDTVDRLVCLFSSPRLCWWPAPRLLTGPTCGDPGELYCTVQGHYCTLYPPSTPPLHLLPGIAEYCKSSKLREKKDRKSDYSRHSISMRKPCKGCQESRRVKCEEICIANLTFYSEVWLS